MKIVVGSAGRRVYLVRWFQEALRQLGLPGHVYVFENDPDAASIAAADGFVHMPPYGDANYQGALLSAIDKIKPRLFFSLNDYELTSLAGGLASLIRERGVTVPSLSLESHSIVADKWKMFNTLRNAGIDTPPTALLSDSTAVSHLANAHERLIIKDRYGSGSSGLQKVQSEELLRWVTSRENGNYSFLGKLDKETPLVVQPELQGQEYGLDVVTPLEGGPMETLLVRRKLAMRGGETNLAETVPAYVFEEVASKLVLLLGSQGLIDVDVIQTDDGRAYVVDVNPRFGGGYPFNHNAGANVPQYYVASIAGIEIRDDWKQYKIAHKAGKYEEIIDLSR